MNISIAGNIDGLSPFDTPLTKKSSGLKELRRAGPRPPGGLAGPAEGTDVGFPQQGSLGP